MYTFYSRPTVTNSDSAPSYIGYTGKSWVGIVNALTYPNGTTHVSQSFIQPQDGSYGNMFLRITSDGSNATYTITNVMLEVGEVEHDCVPAPEDKADVSIRLKNGTNLNSVFNTGIYLLADATSIGNLPSGVSGSQWKTLVVIKLAAGNGTQILMDTNSTHTWIRGWNTNGGIVFTPWDQVAMASTVVKDNGDGTQTLNGKKFRPATYDELTQAISDLKVLIN